MDSLESLGALLREHLDQVPTNTPRMLNYIVLMGISEDYGERVYKCFFNWISNPKHSPENIIHLLDTYIRGFHGFSANIPLQTLVAFPCIEALARRRPTVLKGSWEKVAWIIIKYCTCSNTRLGNGIVGIRTLSKATRNWIVEYSTPELCPDPYLRLELLRLMRSYNCGKFECDRVSLRNKVINTIFQVCDNYSSLTLDQLPNFSPIDLQFVMKDNGISMHVIMNASDLYPKRHEIIVALFRLTRNLALMEKERQLRLDSPVITINVWNAGLRIQLSCCLSFCGLLPYEYITLPGVKDLESEYIECLLCLVQVIGNDCVLLNDLIHTVDTITNVSQCFPDEHDFYDSVTYEKDKVLQIYVKEYIRCFPKYQHQHEMYGGLNPNSEYRLRYFQNNTIEDYNISENDSECYESESNFESNSSDDSYSESDNLEESETDISNESGSEVSD